MIEFFLEQFKWSEIIDCKPLIHVIPTFYHTTIIYFKLDYNLLYLTTKTRNDPIISTSPLIHVISFQIQLPWKIWECRDGILFLWVLPSLIYINFDEALKIINIYTKQIIHLRCNLNRCLAELLIIQGSIIIIRLLMMCF